MSPAGTLDRVERASTRRDRRSGRAARPGPRSHAWTPDQLMSVGQPLPGPVQADFERLLGQSLTDVRIHDDTEAAALAEAVGAAAFVLGSHVFFASGRYDPTSAPGRRLLAHEVAHVVQNRRGAAGAPGDVISGREAEAAQIAEQAAGQEPGRRAAGDCERSRERDRGPEVAPTPPVELPALRYTDAVATGSTDTVKVVDLLLRMIARTLRTDPEDRTGRVRAQLARLAPQLRDDVLSLARTTLTASDYARLAAVADKPDPAGATLSTPAVGADPDDVADAEAAAGGEPVDSTRHSPGGAAPGRPEAPHTHLDGTTHTHGPADAGHHRAEPTGLLGAIAAALFGASPPFAAVGRETPATSGASAAGAPAPGTGPAVAGEHPRAAAAGPRAGQGGDQAAEPVTGAEEELAEGKPAPLAGPAKDEAAAGPPRSPQPGSQQASEPADSPAARIADPEAARAEVASALGAGPGAAAPGPPAAPLPAGRGSQSDAGGAADAASPEQQRIEAEDRTVLETHGHELDARGPADAEGPAEGDPDGEPVAEQPGPGDVAPEPAAPDTPPADNGAAAASAAGTEPAEPVASLAGVVPDVEPAAVVAPPETEPAAAPTGGAQADTGPGVASDAGLPAEPPAVSGPEAAEAESAADTAPGGGGPEAGPESVLATGADPSGGLAACLSGGAGAAQPPAPDPDAPSAGCGGGSGGGSAEPAPAAVPDVSASTPDAALAAVGALPSTDLQRALPQVSAAATADVGKQREATPPPAMERPSGASAALDVAAPIPRRQATPYTGPSQPDKVGTPAGAPTPAPNLQPTPSPSARQVAVATPRLGGDQQLTEADAAKVTESIDSVPTTDAELAVDAGDPGTVALEADADPALVGRQRQALATQVGAVATQGAKDAAAPLGEADIRPHVPPKTLTATPDEGASCPGLAGDTSKASMAPGGSKYPKVALDAIAAEKSKGDIQAGIAKAGADFGSARDKRETDTTRARADSDAQMQAAVEQSNTEQVTLRRGAIGTSTELRGQWTGEQRAAVDTAVDTSDTAARAGTSDVARLKREHEATAQGHVQEGNRQIREAREDAERKARAKKAEAKKEKSGILGWIGSKIASFFEGLKNAITGLFDLARSLVRKAIDGAKKLAHAAIEAGRKAVVGAIKLAGDAIVAAGDVVLAAFPETRAKFREKVAAVVDTATRKVNEAADALERGIQKLLDALGKALDCALQYLQAGYLAAVDALASVVKAALEAAQQFLDMLAEWVGIIADIASDPIGWLKGLGRSAVDGVRNCLWSALKRSIKQWFNDKVEEVVGVGKLILNVLLKGCLTFADIARMAWDGIKAALPGIIIQLIIEKLVALIVPAGAALSLIIDGLRAAWGAASRILAAFQKFMAFLKAVRGGNGPGAFADLVAAAAVAVIDFISNFLIDRLKGAGKGVGDSLKSMAQRIGKALGRAGRAVGRGVRAVGRGLMRGVRAGARLVRRGAAAVVRGGRWVAAAVARGARRVGATRLARAIARSRLGQAVGRGWAKAKGWAAGQRDKFKAKYDEWRKKRQRAKQASAQERLAKAASVIRPGLAAMLRKGASGAWMWAKLRYWQIRFRLSSLTAHGGDDVTFEAHVNPWEVVGKGVKPSGAQLRVLVARVSNRLANHPDVIAGGELIAERAAQTGEISTEAALMGPLGLHAALSRPAMQQSKTSVRSILFGGQSVEVRRFRAHDPREGFVTKLGKYPAIMTMLKKQMPGKSDTEIARAMHEIAVTGRSSGAHAPGLARAAFLYYNFESRRDPRNLVTAAMTVELSQMGKGSLLDLPQAPKGAGKAARFLSDPLDVQRAQVSAIPTGDPATDRARKKKRDDLRAKIKQLQADTLKQAALWLDAKMLAEGLEYFDSPAAAEQWVFDQMLAHYRLLVRVHTATTGVST